MLSLKLFAAAAVLLISCQTTWSQTVEQPEVHGITGQDIKAPSTQHLREAKRQKHPSANVHIENIYIPQQIQKADESVQGYPIYPVYTYPLSAHYDTEQRKPPRRKHQIKPKPSPTETQLPDTLNHRSPQSSQQPFVIYGQNKPEQTNDYISLPYPGILSQHSKTTPDYPYFVIINSPYGTSQRQPKPYTAQQVQQDVDVDDEDDDVDVEPIVTRLPQKSKKTQYKVTQAKRPRPQLRRSGSDSNQGMALANYILAHPLHSATNVLERSAHQSHQMAMNEGRTEDEEGVEEDEGEAEQEITIDDGEEEIQKLNGNIEKIENIDDENEDVDDFKSFQEALANRFVTRRGNKSAVDFILGTKRPTNKIDDRVALVYLRHSKRGRKMLWPEN